MATSDRTFHISVSGATRSEEEQVLAALKDLEAKANNKISGTVSVETAKDQLETTAFARAGDSDAG